MGLTVAFARDFAKHAPLGLYYLMRVIATGDRASLQFANVWARQRYLHTHLGRDEDETVHEDAPDS